MPNLAIIGTNYFQIDLVEQAHKMGYETHMFGMTGKPKNQDNELRRFLDIAGVLHTDVYYPISILEPGRIIERCQNIKPVGVMSVGSDLAVVPMAQVAQSLGLVTNGSLSAICCTNKYEMRLRFTAYDIPQPGWMLADRSFNPQKLPFPLPVMVKAVDRAGKFGITKVDTIEELLPAIEYAYEGSHLAEKVLIEEYVEGKEFTCESLSYNGKHHILTWTEKWSGPPHFVEEMHLQPAPLNKETINYLTPIIHRMLDSLGIKHGPSHCEFKLTPNGEMKVIETAARVVADSIWTPVKITTGINWIEKSIDIAVGKPLDLSEYRQTGDCGFVKFIITKKDFEIYEWLKSNHAEKIVHRCHWFEPYDGREVKKNADRYGYYVVQCSSREEAIKLVNGGIQYAGFLHEAFP